MSTKNQYKASVIITEVKRLQKEFPEAVYKQKSGEGCSYSFGAVSKGPKTRGCIVGQALRNVYPDLFKIAKAEHDTARVKDLLSDLNITYTEKQMDYLETVQSNQDDGLCWSKCHTAIAD